MEQLLIYPEEIQLRYLPDDFKVTTWAKLKPYYDELLKRPIASVLELEQWIDDRNELGALIDEDFGWRYIRLTQNSADLQAMELYQYAVQELSPKISAIEDQLNRKLLESKFIHQLSEPDYFIHLRGIQNEVALFRNENIPLLSEEQLKSKEYGTIISTMMVEINGKNLTLQQAGILLEETNRPLRENAFRKINHRLLENKDDLDRLFDKLLKLRHDIALNAGFSNYRDYKFQAMGRFDYTPEACFEFHESIREEVLPLVDQLYQSRKSALGLKELRPWDLNVDTSGKPPLRPFKTGEELAHKSIKTLAKLYPYFGECLQLLKQQNRLDLDSREGKHPGGYNMPLILSGVPFIFMNAAQSIVDLHTLMHEAGHAVHSVLTSQYRLNSAKHLPSEVAELASMSMEFLSMDNWSEFFENHEDLRRAKYFQLEGALKTLPWVAAVDKFQHWLYTNYQHSAAERSLKWLEILDEFSPATLDRQGLDEFYAHSWHKQLHIFEVPFYYIEYGMAQLGAIAMWKHFRENPEQTLTNYINALRLGYTRPINEIYETAGIQFNFSREYVKGLAQFVKVELEKLG